MTDVQTFENQHLEVFKQVSNITAQRKELARQEKEIKDSLEKAMAENGIKSIDNEYIRITHVAASETISIDMKVMEQKEPDLYEELLEDYPVKKVDMKVLETVEPELYGELIEDYPKVSTRKAHLRFKVK